MRISSSWLNTLWVLTVATPRLQVFEAYLDDHSLLVQAISEDARLTSGGERGMIVGHFESWIYSPYHCQTLKVRCAVISLRPVYSLAGTACDPFSSLFCL